MEYFNRYFLDSSKVLRDCSQEINKLELLSSAMWQTLEGGGSVYWMGNGGSASDAEHLAAELAGRFKVDRRPLSSHALTSNSSLITAIANDYGYLNVFSRQVQAYLKPDDLLIGITTSGKSKNVLSALDIAKSIGAITCLFTGLKTDFIGDYDFIINVNSAETAHIQEAHIAIGQALCGYIEKLVILENLTND